MSDSTGHYGSVSEDIAAMPEAEDVPSVAAQVEPAMQGEIVAPVQDGVLADGAEEAKPILLWRQARFERHRGGQRQDRRHRNDTHDRHQKAAAAPADTQNQVDGKNGSGERRRFDRDRFKSGNPQGAGRPDHRENKPQGERQDRRDGRPDWKSGKSGGKPQVQSKPREERPVRFDPDSPFAKLAALRDQLKK